MAMLSGGCATGQRNQALDAGTSLDEDLQPIEFGDVRQIGDLTFFHRGSCWVDSRLLGSGPAREVVTAGSGEYLALERRLTVDGAQAVLSLPGDIAGPQQQLTDRFVAAGQIPTEIDTAKEFDARFNELVQQTAQQAGVASQGGSGS